MVGGEGRGQRVQRGHQLRTGADLSLVTVGFSWTLVKGFLRREESGLSTPRAPACRQHPPGPPGAAELRESLRGAIHSWLTLTHRFCHPPRCHPSQGRAAGRGEGSVPPTSALGRGATHKAERPSAVYPG